MSSQFQNRLVGVTILVTSVVIFLPAIIDGKKASYEDEFVATPIQPQLQPHTQQIVTQENDIFLDENQTPPEMAADAEVENNQWEIEEVAEPVTITSTGQAIAQQKSANVTSKSTASFPEMAWTIQLGAFQNAKNINALLKKLHKAGFQANTVPAEVIDGQLTRVFVGPDISKSTLEKLLPQLKRLTKLQGKLIPFNALNP